MADKPKPVELMTPKEREAYYLARRKAMIQGDDGVMPSGKTVKQEREEYVEICRNDPNMTQESTESAYTVDAVVGGSELPDN